MAALMLEPTPRGSRCGSFYLPALAIAILFVSIGIANAQPPNSTQKPASSDRRALLHYADAANQQNNGVYTLAIEEWQKLLKDYPQDPLAGKAWHYLGICNMRLEEPDYPAAIGAFQQALKHERLEVREETLFNLGLCLFTQARSLEPGSAKQKQGLQDARQTLLELLKNFADGSFLDQGLFYLGEIEYSLGNSRQSIAYFNKLLSETQLSKSSLRANAQYAVAIAYEEEQQTAQAKRHFEQFLRDNPDHRLATEITVRLADILLKENNAIAAERLLTASEGTDQASKLADYRLLRLGYALSLQGKNAAAAENYQKLLQQYPESTHAATAALSLGQIMHGDGRLDEALEQFRRVLAAQNDQAAEAAHWMAITLLKQNKPSQAVELLDDVLKWSGKTPSGVSLQMDFADALYAQPDQLAQAQKAYEVIASEFADDPLAPRAAYNAAFAALQGGRLSEARRWAEQFLSRYPQNGLRNDVAYVAAEALLLQGEHKAAAEAYAKLRKNDPQNPTLEQWTLRQGMAHYLAGDYATATDLLRREFNRFQTDDQKAEAQFILGASLLYQEDIAGALEQLSASYQTSDKWSSADETLLLLSEAQQRNKETTAARKTLELLLQKFPQTRLKTQVEYKLAQLSAALNDFEQAISRYRGIVQDDNAANYHNFAHYGIAWCLMQQERYQPALDALQPLLQKGLRDSIGGEAKLAEGVCLRKLGKHQLAVDALTQFLTSRPTGVSLGNGLYELGLAYSQLGEVDRATEQFERILNETHNYPAMDKVLYELAWNHQEKSDRAGGTKYFSQLAEQFPQSEFAAEATYMVAQQQYDAGEYAAAAKAYTRVLENTQAAELLEKTYYKLGWSLFQQERYAQAAEQFKQQASKFPTGPLAVDGLFMHAECAFKQDRFDEALMGYVAARQILESASESAASDQVRALIYLHGAQCLREQKKWQECEQWLGVVIEKYATSPYVPTAHYELGYCLQNQNKILDALKAYRLVAENYRNEIGARARFMMGEVYFSQRDFAKAIPEFQKVMYGFDAEKAPDDIKNWQAKSAFEAARCSEVLIESQRGSGREKAIQTAQEFYNFVVEKHATHDLAAQAQSRLGELSKLR